MEMDKEELLNQISQSETILMQLDNTINQLKEKLNQKKIIEEENKNLLDIHNINNKYISGYKEEIKNLEITKLINENDILQLKNEISNKKEINKNEEYIINDNNMINEENIIVEADLIKKVFNSGVDKLCMQIRDRI